MSDYKQQNLSGTSWQRCGRVIITNNYGVVPLVTFCEQRAIDINGEVIINENGELNLTFDPTMEFDIVDDNLQPTGSKQSQEDLLIGIRSLYIHLAKLRDLANEE